MSDLFVDNIKHQSSQGSGTITLGASGETVNVPTGVTTTLTDGVSGDFKMNSGFGSVATAYACRSWVNFNGTGTVAIRDSGNVSSITDNGVGNYTVNFATNMPDVNYASICSNGYIVSTGSQQFMFTVTADDTHTVGTYNVSNRLVDNDAPTFAAADSTGVMVSTFR